MLLCTRRKASQVEAGYVVAVVAPNPMTPLCTNIRGGDIGIIGGGYRLRKGVNPKL